MDQNQTKLQPEIQQTTEVTRANSPEMKTEQNINGPTSSKTRKASLIATIVLIVLIGAAGLFWFLASNLMGTPDIDELIEQEMQNAPSIASLQASPSPDSTDTLADWFVYTTSNFSFKYPPEMEIKASAETNAHGYVGNRRLFEFSSVRYDSSVEKDLLSNVETTTVGGKIAEVVEGPNGLGLGETTPIVHYTIRDGNTLTNLYFYGQVPISQLQKQILSTFEFVDVLDERARGGGVEASWLTYIDRYNNYTLKYPKEMYLSEPSCPECTLTISTIPSDEQNNRLDEMSLTLGILVFNTDSQELIDWENVPNREQSKFDWDNFNGISRIETRNDFYQLGENVEFEVRYVEKNEKTFVIYTYPVASQISSNPILSSLMIY